MKCISKPSRVVQMQCEPSHLHDFFTKKCATLLECGKGMGWYWTLWLTWNEPEWHTMGILQSQRWMYMKKGPLYQSCPPCMHPRHAACINTMTKIGGTNPRHLYHHIALSLEYLRYLIAKQFYKWKQNLHVYQCVLHHVRPSSFNWTRSMGMTRVAQPRIHAHRHHRHVHVHVFLRAPLFINHQLVLIQTGCIGVVVVGVVSPWKWSFSPVLRAKVILVVLWQVIHFTEGRRDLAKTLVFKGRHDHLKVVVWEKERVRRVAEMP